MAPATIGLLDTTVFIALESGRSVRTSLLPDQGVISPITLGELQAGVLAATDVDTRALRLVTLEAAAKAKLLPIDGEVSAQWARLRAHLAETGRRVNVNDLWIAATAAAHDLPIVTQDADFEPLEGVRGIQIIRI